LVSATRRESSSEGPNGVHDNHTSYLNNSSYLCFVHNIFFFPFSFLRNLLCRDQAGQSSLCCKSKVLCCGKGTRFCFQSTMKRIISHRTRIAVNIRVSIQPRQSCVQGFLIRRHHVSPLTPPILHTPAKSTQCHRAVPRPSCRKTIPFDRHNRQEAGSAEEGCFRFCGRILCAAGALRANTSPTQHEHERS